METFWQDIRYGVRSLLRSSGFTLVVVLTLGLGLGANTAIFSVVNSFLLRPLPVRHPEELTVLAVSHEGNQLPHSLSYLDYLDYRQQADSFSDMAGFTIGWVGLSADNRAERITVSFVSSNYFSLLGIEAALGRVLRPPEGETPGADPVLVLGQTYWKKRFGADPGVVGKVVSVNGKPFTIVGVVPEEFRGTFALVEFDAYLPPGMAALDPFFAEYRTRRDRHIFRVLARLKPGVSLRQAQASLDVIARRLEQQYPDTNKTVAIHIYPENLARPEPVAATTNPLLATIFLLLTGLVLLVACVNVANLLLVRATLRQKELAIRAALGAGSVRLLRQLLTESVLLALLGGAAGLVIGQWMASFLGSIRLPGDLPFHLDFSFDWRVFGFVATIALLTGVGAGLLPAWRAARVNVYEGLREGGRALAGGASRHRARNLLVVAQVAGTLVLLIGAGLFVRSLQNAHSVDLGFRPENVLNLSMDPAQQGYDEVRGKEFYRELEERVRALPGVISASLAQSVPMGYNQLGDSVHAEGQEIIPEAQRPGAGYNVVGLHYFETLRIPLLRGRAFTTEDTEDTRRVAIVNEDMAQRLWPGQDPLGKRFSRSGPEGPYVEVVGVSKNGRYEWIFQDRGMYFFLPLAQNYRSPRTLHVLTSVPPQTLSLTIQEQIRALDPNLAVFDVMTMEQWLQGANGFFLINMGALLAGALGLLGLALAVVGVYGVVSYTASQRTHEIGIRMALGAQRPDILRLMLGQGLLLVLMGLTAGAAVALGLARFVANFLFGISAHDPLTFIGVPLLLGGVALVACWIPAWRATRVDPMVALHYE